MASPPHPASPPAVDAPSGCAKLSIFGSVFSQTRQVRERKAKGLHPVNELQRFYILVCCFFCSTTVSITYAFDMFTDDLQSQFGLSNGDLTTVSTVGLVFCYFTIPYGFIYEACGPLILFAVCFFSGGLGSLLMALAFERKVKGTTATFSVYYAFLNTCSGLIDVAYITTLAELFPRNRGPIIALAKVMTSLGSSALACLCVNIFNSDMISYIYFLMALVMVVSAWASLTVTLPPYYMNWWRRRGKTEEEIAELEATKPYYERKFVPKARLIVGYSIVAALIVFFAVQSPVLAYVKNVPRGGRVAVGVVCIVLVLSIIIICLPLRCLGGVDEPAPAEEQREVAVAEPAATDEPAEQTDNTYLDDDVTVEGLAGKKAAAKADLLHRQDPRYQGTMRNYLCTPDLWLIFVASLFQGVVGTLVSYNSSTISVAINGYKRSMELSALYTAFLGVGSAVGRIALGLFEAYVQHQKPGHRKVIITMALPVAPIVATVAGILLVTLPGKAILFPYILTYFENGWSAAFNALIFPCLFENCHNSLYNISFAVTMVSIICFNRLMFGIFIDKQEKKLRASGVIPDSVTGCPVKSCVLTPLIVATCCAAASSVASIIVHVRYSRFLTRYYNSLDAGEASSAEGSAGVVLSKDIGSPVEGEVRSITASNDGENSTPQSVTSPAGC